MLKLPKIPYSMEKNKQQVVSFRGINYSDMLTDGDAADSYGISMRRFPYITNKKGRAKRDEFSNVGRILAHEGKLCRISQEGLFCVGAEGDDFDLGDVSTDIQAASVNSKLVLMPYKKYYDSSDEKIHNLEASIKLSATKFTSNAVCLAEGIVGTGPTCVFNANERSLKCERNLQRQFYINPFYGGWFVEGQTITLIEFCATVEDCVLEGGEGSLILKFKILSSSSTFSLTNLSEKVISIGLCVFTCESAEETTIDGSPGAAITIKGDIDKDKLPTDRAPLYVYNSPSSEISPPPPFDKFFEAGDYVRVALGSGGCWTRVTAVDGYSITFSDKLTDTLKDVSNVWIQKPGWRNDVFQNIHEDDKIVILGSRYNTGALTVSSISEEKGDYRTFYKIQFTEGAAVTDETIRVSAYEQLNQLTIFKETQEMFSELKKGDVVTISGCANNANNISFAVDSYTGEILHAQSDVFIPSEENAEITITRKIPELDYICENNNRLWGCSNKENAIYASALGDPTNMYVYSGISTDSFSVVVGSSGAFTGCCRYGSAVLYFKEDKIHKVLGAAPSDFTLYSYDYEGVQKGSEKSLVVINEVLYYKGVHGVYAYDGGYPKLISENFGNKRFYDAVAGSDGVNYYISMRDENDDWYVFSYNTLTGMWVQEEKNFQAVNMIRVGENLLFLDEEGSVYTENQSTDFSNSEWMIRFTPFYETMEGKKTYSRILVRAEIPYGSYMTVELRCDDGRMNEIGKVVGKKCGVIPIIIPINRCDKFELKLSGRGAFTIQSMLREYYVGGDR